jgi:hypothetical protein
MTARQGFDRKNVEPEWRAGGSVFADELPRHS